MSEAKQEGALIQGGGKADQAQRVAPLGGRMRVRWDEGAKATPHGQRVFLAEFLAPTGVFERWVSACPLQCRSGDAPKDERDVLGRLMLRLRPGYWRSAHITGSRGDAVTAQAPCMSRIVSEDALRRALERMTRHRARRRCEQR